MHIGVITHGGTLPDSAQKTDFYGIVDNATVTGIVNADISNSAAIVDSKLEQITTASKVSGTSLTGLASIPAGAGVIPSANIPTASVYVDRGNPSADDFTAVSFTTDGNWHDLNLSSIVPAGAKAVAFVLQIKNTATDKSFTLRKKSNTNGYNIATAASYIANVGLAYDLMIGCDTDRIIQYNATNSTWTYILLTVKGWWL